MEEVFQAIISFTGSLEKPAFEEGYSVSPEAWDLIGRLVTHQEKRYCKITDFSAHPFFQLYPTDWDNLRERKDPPFTPQLDSNYDTAYFGDQNVNVNFCETPTKENSEDVNISFIISFTQKLFCLFSSSHQDWSCSTKRKIVINFKKERVRSEN